MDGVAIKSAAFQAGVRRFTVQATQGAGAAPLRLKDGDYAIEVMTGAKIPQETDVVIPLEEYSLDGGIVTLGENTKVSPNRNIQRQGEDGPLGSIMLRSGTLLGPPEIAVAASAGFARLQVSAEPAFMIVATGDELIEPGEPIAEHQIRQSNAYAMVAALRSRGFQRIGHEHIADDESRLIERLGLHLATHDVLILSGGVSMGRFDLVPGALKHLGVREVFHKVAQRPGKPMWFGVGQNGQTVFGLPGNPVSALVCLIRFVIPAIVAAAGAGKVSQERLALSAPISVDLPLTLYMPVSAVADQWGRIWAKPRPTNTSGDYISLVGTDGFIELPPGPNTYPKEFVANLYRW